MTDDPGGGEHAALQSRLNTQVPHSARVWNYFLGGKDNYAADRAAAEQALRLMPELVESARADRAFLGRAVQFLAGEAGIRQFLDIGTGLPTANNTHEVAQAVAPECRVVYVDNDPLVLVHARALLVGTAEGATDYVDADARDPEAIIEAAAGTLDFDQPVAIMLLGILNFVLDDDEAASVVRRLVDAVVPGSYLVVSHPTTEVHPDAVAEAMRQWNESGAAPITARSPRELARFFEGLELIDPGVVTCTRWYPGGGPSEAPAVSEFCGVARKA